MKESTVPVGVPATDTESLGQVPTAAEVFSGAKRNDTRLVYFLLNVALMWLLLASTIVNARDMRFFTFSWTRRLQSNDAWMNMSDAKEDITRMYHDNDDSSLVGLGRMMDTIFRNASCRPVLYDGGLDWMPHEVSPTCNCLRNIHVDYIKAVRPQGVGLSANQFRDPDTISKTKNTTNAMRARCFDSVRPTQVKTICHDFVDEHTAA